MSNRTSNKKIKRVVESVTNGIFKSLPHPNEDRSYVLLFSASALPVCDHFEFTRRHYATISLTADQMKGDA